MSYELVEDAARELDRICKEQLEEGERKYGSFDAHIKERSLAERVDYVKQRIKTYLETIEAGEGDPAKLIADCQNHLHTLFAKLVLEGKIPAPTAP